MTLPSQKPALSSRISDYIPRKISKCSALGQFPHPFDNRSHQKISVAPIGRTIWMVSKGKKSTDSDSRNPPDRQVTSRFFKAAKSSWNRNRRLDPWFFGRWSIENHRKRQRGASPLSLGRKKFELSWAVFGSKNPPYLLSRDGKSKDPEQQKAQPFGKRRQLCQSSRKIFGAKNSPQSKGVPSFSPSFYAIFGGVSPLEAQPFSTFFNHRPDSAARQLVPQIHLMKLGGGRQEMCCDLVAVKKNRWGTTAGCSKNGNPWPRFFMGKIHHKWRFIAGTSHIRNWMVEVELSEAKLDGNPPIFIQSSWMTMTCVLKQPWWLVSGILKSTKSLVD